MKTIETDMYDETELDIFTQATSDEVHQPPPSAATRASTESRRAWNAFCLSGGSVVEPSLASYPQDMSAIAGAGRRSVARQPQNRPLRPVCQKFT